MPARTDEAPVRPPTDHHKPGPLQYYVATPARPQDVLHGPGSFRKTWQWAQQEAQRQAIPMDVCETTTGVDVVRYDAQGRSIWKD